MKSYKDFVKTLSSETLVRGAICPDLANHDAFHISERRFQAVRGDRVVGMCFFAGCRYTRSSSLSSKGDMDVVRSRRLRWIRRVATSVGLIPLIRPA